MAIEILSDDDAGFTPRTSFSFDFLQSDVPPPLDTSHTTSTDDFDFCNFRESLDDVQSSSADELFFDGKILPVGIKQSRRSDTDPPRRLPVSPPVRKSDNPCAAVDEEKISEKQKLMIWQFNRGGDVSPLISRSNSDASYGGRQRPPPPHVMSNQKQKQSPLNRANSQGYYRRNPIEYSPMLNVASASFFGLASIFSGGKNRSKKKH